MVVINHRNLPFTSIGLDALQYVVTECGHVEAELTNIIGMLSGNGIGKLRGQTASGSLLFLGKGNRYVHLHRHTLSM